MIAVSLLAALVAATSFDCSSIAAVIVAPGESHSNSGASSTTNALGVGRVAVPTVTVTVRETVSVPALSNVLITSAPALGNTAITDGPNDYMTIAISNTYGRLSDSFGIWLIGAIDCLIG